MARTLDEIIAKLPAKRQAKIRQRADELATLKNLRQITQRTQADIASTLGVGQDAISRIEQRKDMLLSTLTRYVEAMGGKLELVAQFPNRPPVIINHLVAREPEPRQKRKSKSGVAGSKTPV